MWLCWSGGDELAGDRHQDLVEFGPHHVLELKPAGAFPELNLFVVGQVDRDRFRARVGLTRVVECVVGVEVGVRARALALVRLGHREAALEPGQEARVAGQLRAPRLVLEQHVCFRPRLVAREPIEVGLDRPDHDVERVALHVEPGKIARLILVGLQGRGPELEVPAKTGVVRERCGLAQARRGVPGRRLEGLVVGNRDEPPRAVTADDGVEPEQVGRLLDLVLASRRPGTAPHLAAAHRPRE